MKEKSVITITILLLLLIIGCCTKIQCPTPALIDSSAFIKINIPSSRISNAQVQSNNSYTDSTSVSILATTVSISITPDTIIYTYDISRAYFKFDFSDVPTGVTIGKAQLILFTDDTAESLIDRVNVPFDTIKAGTMIMKKVISYWNSATLEWSNQPTSDASNAITIPFSKTNATCTIDLTTIAQYQYSNPIVNYGVVLQLITEVATRGQVFYSVQGPASMRPQLIIEYY